MSLHCPSSKQIKVSDQIQSETILYIYWISNCNEMPDKYDGHFLAQSGPIISDFS